MRLALFSVINVAGALLFGVQAYWQGFGAGRIAVHVVIALVVVQLAYVLWLVVIASLRNRKEAPQSPSNAEPVAASRGRATMARAPNSTGNHAP